ncbi:hypothetical protein [Chelativorans salis]|uniref:Uncharacterized protein n=1 Tax=Chelativorans salis TaxID=2978478 RepID=A0ABT2LMC1_9HYPH|nr:hypothetical protein [Chelativorans sp. EGI FJ00035]MCT7375731.1 hypothetical protein [Chelativorans sp. EGI FJ00035]
MTDTIIDVPAPPPAIDTEITDFRAQYDEALNSRAHPEHSVRSAQLSALFEKKYSGDTTSTEPAAAPERELDVVGGDEPAQSLDKPISQASEVDFSSLKAKDIPGAESDEQLEAVAREWAVAGELNAVEVEGLSLQYAAALETQADPVALERAEIIAQEHMRRKYGPDMGATATAALRVADETFGLREFLDQNPAFAANPQVIDKLITVAKRKGYFA